MSVDFRSARFWAREMIEGAMFEGACAVDATMGNGHDTQWLCELAGEAGRVYAFDVQAEAVERTAERLREAGLGERAHLFCAGHQHMCEYVHEPVDAIVFNLGWLPGAEHGVTTRTETTLQAVNAALDLLKDFGWEHDIDQLKRVVRTLMLESSGPYITAEDTQRILHTEKNKVIAQGAISKKVDFSGTLDEIMNSVVKAIVEEEGMNQSRAAKRLGISRSTMWRRLK